MKYQTLTIKGEKITDFAKERNKALDLAQAEWVLFLDSDEIVSSGLEAEIRNLKPDPQKKGYYIPRKGIVEEKLLRLARKDAGKWFRKVHEVWKIKGKTGILRNPIIHKEDRNLRETIDKINFYSTLHAEANKKEGKRASIFKIIFYPKLKFLQTFLVKKAYKSGMKGFVFSLIQAFQSYLAWTKLYFSSF